MLYNIQHEGTTKFGGVGHHKDDAITDYRKHAFFRGVIYLK